LISLALGHSGSASRGKVKTNSLYFCLTFMFIDRISALK
jgi:hypothetical protein